LVCTFRPFLSFFDGLSFWGFFIKVFGAFVLLKLFVFEWRIEILLLISFILRLLLLNFVFFLSQLGGQFGFSVFLFDLHVIVNLFANKALVFVFDVKIYLDIYVVSMGYPGPASFIVTPSWIFIHCSYNNNSYYFLK